MKLCSASSITAERLRRQCFLEPLAPGDEEGYIKLFRLLQPVSPGQYVRPGSPPTLAHRVQEGDERCASSLRERSLIVKGRFGGGRVGYVYREDLRMYATVFRKRLKAIPPAYEAISSLLRQSGGLSKEQLKQELDHYPAGEISKALMTMQEAFLLYEHQPDPDWDTGWFDFAAEWFELDADEAEESAALADILSRFIEAMVWVSEAHIRGWSRLPVREIRRGLSILLEEGRILEAEAGTMGKGYMLAKDAPSEPAERIPQTVFMLDKSDIWVRAYQDELTKRFGKADTLQYLLIDGELRGAVLGRWGFNPYDIEDIVTDLPPAEAQARKEEIIRAVSAFYDAERHPIRSYQGKQL